MKIEEIIENNQGGTVLFLGRVTNFTPKELSLFLEAHGMNYTNRYNGQDIALTVLSTMVTPLEEEFSYELYDKGIPEVRLAQFEEFYTKHIKPNTLMMSLKLSNDQERLKRLLKNSAFSDEVFLKLFKMYNWGDDGVYENDENRDVTICFVERFYRPDGFRDPAMVYSPITLSNIARDAKTADILDAMLTMPNHEIKQSRKEDLRPKNLREIVALNPNISYEIIRYLLSFNNNRVNSFLACNSSVGVDGQRVIFNSSDDITKLMLTQNDSLDDDIFLELLNEKEEIVASLLRFQKITPLRVKYILEHKFSNETLSILGENRLISEVVSELIGLARELDYRLASNVEIENSLLSRLYDRYGDEFIVPLSSNRNLSTQLLREFYKSDNREVILNLASNRATPKDILRELAKRDEHEINCRLALNPSVELEYLQQFALNTELIMLMSQNETYLASVNSAHLGMRSDDRY